MSRDLIAHFLMLIGAWLGGNLALLSLSLPESLAPPAQQAPSAISLYQPRAISALPPAPRAAIPSDRKALIREIQRELTRVGCYDGKLSGTWDARSQLALKNFIDVANARLPVKQPDYVHLQLAQAYSGRPCAEMENRPRSKSGDDLPKPPSLVREGRLPSGHREQEQR